MQTNRYEIINFFDFVSKKEFMLEKHSKYLYSYFLKRTKGNSYSEKMKLFKDDKRYFLFRTASKHPEKFTEFCFERKIYLDANVFKFYNFKAKDNLTNQQTMYFIKFKEIPTCKTCNKPLKIHLYNKTSKIYCSDKCASDNIVISHSEMCTNSNSELIEHGKKISKIKCNICKCLFTRNTSNIFSKAMFACNTCNAKFNSNESIIFEFINQYYTSERCNRSIINPKELDIFCSSLNFAVEYNGLVFHSEGSSKYSLFNYTLPKKYHLEKTEACEKLGIQLFHIFENEWLNTQKQAIWKSVLLSKMHLTEKIPARKCVIREVSSKDSNAFLEENHLQGACNASTRVGLYYKDELVSLMTFGKPRFNKKAQYELIRFCSKINTTVQGAGSKLLKYFERSYSPESIVSYANRRWSEGNLYEKLGFDFVQNTEVNYFYFKAGSLLLESRNKYQKHKLKKLLDVFDSEKTETENMFLNDYRRIFDSGNKVYLKRY